MTSSSRSAAAGVDRRPGAVGDGVLVIAELEELARWVGAAALIGHPLLGREVRSETAAFSDSAVLDHTFGFDVNSRSTIETNHWPLVGEADGCSSKPSGGMIQETLGNNRPCDC